MRQAEQHVAQQRWIKHIGIQHYGVSRTSRHLQGLSHLLGELA
jgi:hypothetical protein